ncbi:MAG: hypothetical protein HY263_11705, partial [Chloroflexi bacterium]|nr:hypothetical protein [Chloroflexota bacterium]
ESFGFTITRIDVRPGPLDCGVIWPGAQSQAICLGAFVIPGRAMSAWVGFAETSKVAVVGLFRDFPFASAPPSGSIWTATLLAYEVPPTACTWP